MVKKNEVDKFCLNSISGDSSDWYILEVDLEYPHELHELQNDYPLAPEKLELVIICCQNIVVILQMF